jgi:hypothetical protein
MGGVMYDFKTFGGGKCVYRAFLHGKKNPTEREPKTSPVESLKPPEPEPESKKRPIHGVNQLESFTQKKRGGKRNTINFTL